MVGEIYHNLSYMLLVHGGVQVLEEWQIVCSILCRADNSLQCGVQLFLDIGQDHIHSVIYCIHPWALQATCRESGGGLLTFLRVTTRHLKNFMATEVRVKGLQSLAPVGFLFLALVLKQCLHPLSLPGFVFYCSSSWCTMLYSSPSGSSL